MTVTVTSFRQDMPEFTDPSVYSAAMITRYINLGVNFQNQYRWDPSIIDYGTELFVAHNCVLDARNTAAVAAGGIPGTVQGVQTSKGADKVNVSYDTQAVTLENGEFWNMTTYGIRFLQLSRQYGTGGMQIGTGPCGSGAPYPGFGYG